MELMGHRDPDVRCEASSIVQRLMSRQFYSADEFFKLVLRNDTNYHVYTVNADVR
jgi:hypothetical protein